MTQGSLCAGIMLDVGPVPAWLARAVDIVTPTVRMLVAGRIVGWFQGRMEFGARALRFRSILANPMVPDMKDALNTHVKFRGDFRPFARQ
jgi:predicted NodU family carbamoyl transferase